MKKHTWLAGLVVLSISGYGCGDKATAEKAADTSATSTSTADKKDAKNDGKAADKSEKPAADKDAKKPDAAIGSGTPAASNGGGAAIKHLSDDCQVALHMDMGQFINDAAVQKELVPTIDEILATPNPKDEKFAKVQGAIKELGFDYKKVQDMAFCVTNVKDFEHSFGVVVAAGLKADSLVPAIEKLDEKKKATFEDIDGHKVAIVKDGVAIGQAADGSVIIGATKDMYKKLSAATGMSSAPLDASKFFAFGVRPAAVATLIELMDAKGKGKDDKTLEPLKHIKEVTGYSDFSALKSEISVNCETADDAKGVDALLTIAKGKLSSEVPDPKVADALKSLQSKVDGSKVVISVTTPREIFDQQIKMIGMMLNAQKGKM